MIVEDEAVIALRLQHSLTSLGFDVVGVAYSGEEAVETARDLRPDLILTDIMIPGKLDGIQVADCEIRTGYSGDFPNRFFRR